MTGHIIVFLIGFTIGTIVYQFRKLIEESIKWVGLRIKVVWLHHKLATEARKMKRNWRKSQHDQ